MSERNRAAHLGSAREPAAASLPLLPLGACLPAPYLGSISAAAARAGTSPSLRAAPARPLTPVTQIRASPAPFHLSPAPHQPAWPERRARSSHTMCGGSFCLRPGGWGRAMFRARTGVSGPCPLDGRLGVGPVRLCLCQTALGLPREWSFRHLCLFYVINHNSKSCLPSPGRAEIQSKPTPPSKDV